MATTLRSFVFGAFLMGGFLPSLAAQTISGSFSADNSYAIWIGNSTSVQTLVHQATNTQAQDIRDGETFSFTYTPQCQIYIAAWSDDIVYQGLIGSFTGGVTLSTGDPAIQVLAAGMVLGPTANLGNNQFPTQAQMNAALAGGSFVAASVGSPPGGPPWNFGTLQVPGLDPSARWIWHNSGNDPTTGAPFEGFNHDEFLIFRVPCDELVPPPKDVYAVKFLCGSLPIPKSGPEGPAKPGNYLTAINVHNPNYNQVIVHKKAILLYRNDRPPDPETPMPPHGFHRVELKPNWGFEIDCRDIRTVLLEGPPGSAPPAPTFLKGWVVIEVRGNEANQANPLPLDVTAVYTSHGYVRSGGVVVPEGFAEDVETILPKQIRIELLDEPPPTEEPCCGQPFSAFDSVDDRSSATVSQTISGTSRKDCLIGGSAGDVIAGRGDDDCIVGNGGNDELHGDQGTTVLNSGKDIMFGGPGHDTMRGDANDDEIHGGEDGDDIFGDAGADRIFGDRGDDTIRGDAGQDFVDGGEGDDVIDGDAQSDTICGGPGRDSIHGRAQGDIIDGGADNDICDGDSGADDCWRCETRTSCSSQSGSSAACPP